MELPELKIKDDPKYKIVESSLRMGHIKYVSVNQNVLNRLPFKFNHSLPEATVATDQHASGRCWIFAGLNVIRHKMIQKHGLPPDFQLSQAYLFRCDKLEKCNTAIELVYELAKNGKTNSSLEYSALIENTISDGGTAQEFSNLVKKYGVIPKESYAEVTQSRHSHRMNDLLKITVCKTSNVIHGSIPRRDFETYKKQILDECNRIITLCLGTPPTRFVWTVKETNVSKEYTPVSFYKLIVKPLVNIENYVCIVHDPRHEYKTLLCVEYLHNVLEPEDKDLKRKITSLYLNVDINMLKQAVYNSIVKLKEAVWFATDYGTFVLNDATVLDQKASIMKSMFDVEFVFDKKLSYESRITIPNHAMVFVGCHKEGKEYKRWKVENSHGADTEQGGFLTMSDAFFEQYVVCAFVHKKTLPPVLVKKWKKRENIKWLPFWDVLGIYA